MKALVVHPGANFSTHDVHMGVLDGLRANGVPFAEFRLDGRIDRTHDFLHFLWRRQRKQHPEAVWPKPTSGDVLYQASQGLVERALERRCTDVIVVSAMFVMPDRLELARRAGLRVWLLCTESPYAMDDELRLASLVDGVWTNERAVVPAFAAVNPNAAYLPHAWRPGVHDRVSQAEPDTDVLFCGSLFHERIAWLEQIDWTGIALALYGTTEVLPKRSPLRPFVKGGIVQNADVVALAQRSRVVLNLFRDPQGQAAESLNPRCWEMAAAGVCVVSDPRAEVQDVFGAAMPTFSTPREAETVIRALLADPTRRAQCVQSAKSAVQHETWTARVSAMLNHIHQWRHQPQQRSA